MQIGGDFYDVIPAGDGAVLLVIADVMGKGVPAALFAAVLRSTIRSLRHLFAQPGELLGAVNKTLFPGPFASEHVHHRHARVSGSRARRDDLRQRRTLSAALLQSGHGKIRARRRAGFPLGIEANTAYRQTMNALPPGAAALLYTDGLTEARNAAGEFLGEHDLRDYFTEAAAQTLDAEGAKQLLLRRLAEFRGATPLTDDQTLILIRHVASE